MTRYHGFRKILSLFLLFNAIAYGTLFYKMEYSTTEPLIYGLIVTVILCVTSIIIILNQLGDEYLFLIVSMQIAIGAINIYRIEQGIAKGFDWKHLIFIIIGTSLFFITYIIYIKFFKYWSNFTLLYFFGANIIVHIYINIWY